jgi:hypothetical protein
MSHLRFWMVICLVSALATACAGKKKIESTEIYDQAPAPDSDPPLSIAKTRPEEPKKKIIPYSVVRGDTLWDLSGKFYEDPFQWPLIFKTNRDIIRDPDLIYPKQNIRIEKEFTSEEKSKARRSASQTPKYVPHLNARQKLPVDYF